MGDVQSIIASQIPFPDHGNTLNRASCSLTERTKQTFSMHAVLVSFQLIPNFFQINGH